MNTNDKETILETYFSKMKVSDKEKQEVAQEYDQFLYELEFFLLLKGIDTINNDNENAQTN